MLIRKNTVRTAYGLNNTEMVPALVRLSVRQAAERQRDCKNKIVLTSVQKVLHHSGVQRIHTILL